MFYFAYGSNMNWPQMRRRCPSSRFVCIARLPNYGFAIARHSRLRGCGTANIFIRPDHEVWGVVYEVSEGDMETMDGFEDGYSRERVFAYGDNGNASPMEVIVYIAPTEAAVPRPSAEYKELLLEGARFWKLPAQYCLMLEQIDAAVS
jgi:gamma-glutamylcyclotransferase (GGCT)/AIG2-like uncharacterized protein YtfP